MVFRLELMVDVAPTISVAVTNGISLAKAGAEFPQVARVADKLVASKH